MLGVCVHLSCHWTLGALRHLDLSRCHMRDDFIVTPDGTPASLAQPMGSSVLEDDSDVKVNNDKNDDDEDNTTVVGGSGFVGFGPVSTNHDEVPGPVSVCDAITENFTLDVLRVDQNRLSAAVSVGILSLLFKETCYMFLFSKLCLTFHLPVRTLSDCMYTYRTSSIQSI